MDKFDLTEHENLSATDQYNLCKSTQKQIKLIQNIKLQHLQVNKLTKSYENDQVTQVLAKQLRNVQDNTQNEQIFKHTISDLITNALQTLVQMANLSNSDILEFGYRKFLKDGTTIGFNTRNESDSKTKHLYRYSLKQFYDRKLNNNLVIYKKTQHQIEGFYFLASSHSPEITKCYVSNIESFEHFINLVKLQIEQIADDITNKNILDKNLSVRVFSKEALAILFPDLTDHLSLLQSV